MKESLKRLKWHCKGKKWVKDMLTAFSVKNFKFHKETQLELGNLTLLTGVNSAGKTSLIQALLLLRQSWLTDRLMQGLDLNGPLCKIGTAQDALYRQADRGILDIKIDAEESFLFSYDAETALNSSFLPPKEYSETATREKLEKCSLFNQNFQYVSSLRLGGKSHFPQFNFEVDQHQISQILGQGECVAHFLYKFGTESTFNYLFDDKEYLLSSQVEQWERRISEGITINVQKNMNEGFDIHYGYVRDGEKNIMDLKAENIGYGISHSLPIVVALLAAKPNDLVILENPEAHLHPKGQAELAKLISRIAQHGVQLIVETHSDHILNGIQLAAKNFEEGKQTGLDRSKIKIYYVTPEPTTQTYAVAQKVTIESNGLLDKQPQGFFDQAEMDLIDLNGF